MKMSVRNSERKGPFGRRTHKLKDIKNYFQINRVRGVNVDWIYLAHDRVQ
jgi:hypothetical protein